MAVTTPQPEELEKVRIGVLTDLLTNRERDYFTHLKELLGKREDCQVLKLSDPINYDTVDADAAESLKQKYQIDMIICVKFFDQYALGGLMVYTKLVDISGQRLVKLKRINLGRRGFAYGWEKKSLMKQIKPIEKMIDEIHRK